MAKAVTKYQEFEEDDLEYRRPFLLPFEGVKSIKSFLEPGNEEEITNNVDPEALENLFEEEDEK